MSSVSVEYQLSIGGSAAHTASKGRPFRKLSRELSQVDVIPSFESHFSDFVLLNVVMVAQAHAPLVRGFEPQTAVGAGAHMGAFDRQLTAAGNRAAMAPHPGAMRGTGAGASLPWLSREAAWKAELRHPLSPVPWLVHRSSAEPFLPFASEMWASAAAA